MAKEIRHKVSVASMPTWARKTDRLTPYIVQETFSPAYITSDYIDWRSPVSRHTATVIEATPSQRQPRRH